MIGIGDTNFKAFPIPEFDAPISVLYITFVQDNKKILEYNINDVDILKLDDDITHVCLHMPQEDSLRFKYTGITTKDSIEVQLRLRTISGEAYQSIVMYDRPSKCLKEGII